MIGTNQETLSAAIVTTLLTIVFIALMLTVVRRALDRGLPLIAGRLSADGGGRLAIVVIGVLASAVITEAIGIHAIVGAFLFGAVIPHSSWGGSEVADGDSPFTPRGCVAMNACHAASASGVTRWPASA